MGLFSGKLLFKLGGSIYGRYFPEEPFKLVHDKAGILTIANRKINTNDSQLIITLGPANIYNYIYLRLKYH